MEYVNKLSVISYTHKTAVSNLKNTTVYTVSGEIQNYHVCHTIQCLLLDDIILTHCCRAGLLIKYPLVTGHFKRF